MTEAFHHRSSLKQTNKPFKSKHATKSSLKEIAKGRAPRQSPKVAHASAVAAQNKLNRRNHAKQAQAVKRQALISAARVFSGADGAPRIIAVIPLSEDIVPHTVAAALTESTGISEEDSPHHGIWKVKVERFKTSLQFVQIPYGLMYAALDACKVADYVVFALSPEVEVALWGDTLLRALQAQGLPTVISVVAPGFSSDPKTRAGVLRSLLSFIQYFTPDQTRVYDLNVQADCLNALRAVAEGTPRDVRWREGRPWVLSEAVAWKDGALAVTGIVRGGPLSANRLIHIPNFGDFQIAKIESASLPRAARDRRDMDVEPVVPGEPDDDADSLISSNDPDDMANEQTWPTEEEMRGADDVNGDAQTLDSDIETISKAEKRIPKGMSEYQASWIIDEDDEDDAGDEDDVDGEEDKEDVAMEAEEMAVVLEEDETEAGTQKSVRFEDLDAEEEERQLEKWRKRKREEQDNLEFPDEIDTPQEIPARERFQRYRGMQSFRTSPWDPYENLPRDYARIFQFEDYKRTERSVRRRAEQDTSAIQPGSRVTVTLKGVHSEAANADLVSPFILFGLHQHEHKKTVLSFAVQRNTEYEEPVRSKDALILCVGPRRFRVNPIYSQHSRGGSKGTNNVHKFERYLRHGQTYVATIYGPVIFGNQPCVLLRDSGEQQSPALVATGSFLHPDPTRIIAKRIVLSGHPFKVHKKTATVRYMFFNADDVLYFKPIQLHTKYGRVGHIRESLGTHGYFKAHFDGPINQMDTVCMSLYKRVFPRWGELYVVSRTTDSGTGDEMEE